MTHYLPFMLFAFVASITPGPTNILVLSNSALHGLGTALRIALGACAGAALIVFLTGLGLGEFLGRLPWLQQLMAWLGVAWISVLAWQLWRAAPSALATDGQNKAMGAWAGAGLQLINPKTWMMALAVVSVFTGAQARAVDYGMYAAIFFLIAIPCLLVWALLGRGAVRFLATAQAMQRFNRCMALLLLGSAWGGLLL